MIPAGVGARENGRRAEAAHGVHLLPARRGDGQVDAENGRRACDLPPILKPLDPFKKHLTVVSGLENKSAIAAPVHAITPGTWLQLRAAAHQPRAVWRHHGRPDRRETHRPGHAAAVARDRDGRAGRRRLLRPQLWLQLRQDDFVPRPVDAAADGAQPAQAVPAALRRRATPRRSARCSPRRTRACSISCAQDAKDPGEDARPARPRARSTTISTRCARSSGGWRSSPRAICPAVKLPDAPVGHPEQLRRAHEAHVRHDGARVPGEPHARRDAHDGRRGEQPAVQPHRHLGRVPSAVASPEQPAEAGAPGEGADLSHAGVREVREEAGGAAGWRGARCSTTRSCCSAAT